MGYSSYYQFDNCFRMKLTSCVGLKLYKLNKNYIIVLEPTVFDQPETKKFDLPSKQLVLEKMAIPPNQKMENNSFVITHQKIREVD